MDRKFHLCLLLVILGTIIVQGAPLENENDADPDKPQKYRYYLKRATTEKKDNDPAKPGCHYTPFGLICF
uniref:Peptide Hact-1 n=1 Tax=Heliofungia actiniformis TaxID=75303 RepID=HACT1_HELAT|nr:RecName: Full=Peptide Hact-1; Flags: Precursor [Heliofungia actiniformis]